MYKNVAGQHTFAVVIEASTGNPKTSGVDFYITKDDGVQAAADSSTHVGNGQWRIAFTQAETNADVMGLSWSGTDVVANGMTFYPVTKKVSDLIDAAAAPSAATVASQVRTELGTELGRIDVAISSRNATTPPTVGAVAEGVWAAENRSLTDKANFTLASSEHTSIATAVWATTTRTLSSFGSLVADMAAAVWAYTGRALTVNPPTAAAIRSELDNNSTKLGLIDAATAQLASTLESDGDGGYQFTEKALENAPTGDGGTPGWTPEEKAAAIAALEELITLGKCDIVTNTETVPWREEYRKSGTGELLFFKYLQKLDGSPVTSINDYAAYKLEIALP